ncbi:MAG: nucleotidyltransferase domain-containing protein [Thermodesulfovibrionales bacterium]|nr:nucleotidyltransferase domain-containing protein [Thermodesulfovibrionales bacterium]
MLKEVFIELEKRLLEEIKAHYGERLVSVAIFGSQARQTQRFDSDIDILIIAEGLPAGRMKRIRDFEEIEGSLEPFIRDLQKKGINTYISPVFKTPEEAMRGSPLFIDMTEDARIIFDRNDFFKNILLRLKKRLEELGAKRVWKGNTWYWILKRDFRPGEVFEI